MMKKNTILVPLMCCHSGGMFFSPRRAEGCAGVPARVARKLSPFTLIELVVTIAIIVLTVAIVSAVFREESPARALENAENDFRAYCGRVRYRACETGRDWVINYDPEKKQFTASPGKFEKFQMPGGEGQAGPVPDDEEPDPDDPENESGSENGYSRLVWSLPEKFVFTTEHGDEDNLMTGEKMELFRFFPDGGGSGAGFFELRREPLSRIFRISRLTGRLNVIDREEYEREQIER